MSEKTVSFYVPGYKPSNIEYATALNSTNIVICLEDGTPENKKLEGRHLVKRAIQKYRKIPKEFIVRINGYKTKHCIPDLDMILPMEPNRLRIPMLDSLESFISLDNYIKNFCRENNIVSIPQYEIMIESKKMLDSMEDIIKYSDNIYAFTIGGEDYEIDARTYSTDSNGEVLKAKLKIAQFCKCNNIYSFDTTYMDYLDSKGFYENCLISKSLGFTGRSIIHPNQVKIAREVYSN